MDSEHIESTHTSAPISAPALASTPKRTPTPMPLVCASLRQPTGPLDGRGVARTQTYTSVFQRIPETMPGSPSKPRARWT